MTSKTSYLSIFFGVAIFMASSSYEAARAIYPPGADLCMVAHSSRAEIRFCTLRPQVPRPIPAIALRTDPPQKPALSRHPVIESVVLIAWNICYDWLPEHLTFPLWFLAFRDD